MGTHSGADVGTLTDVLDLNASISSTGIATTTKALVVLEVVNQLLVSRCAGWDHGAASHADLLRGWNGLGRGHCLRADDWHVRGVGTSVDEEALWE